MTHCMLCVASMVTDVTRTDETEPDVAAMNIMMRDALSGWYALLYI